MEERARRIQINRLWDKFQQEAQYVTLDGKIQLKTIAMDFAEYVLDNQK